MGTARSCKHLHMILKVVVILVNVTLIYVVIIRTNETGISRDL